MIRVIIYQSWLSLLSINFRVLLISKLYVLFFFYLLFWAELAKTPDSTRSIEYQPHQICVDFVVTIEYWLNKVDLLSLLLGSFLFLDWLPSQEPILFYYLLLFGWEQMYRYSYCSINICFSFVLSCSDYINLISLQAVGSAMVKIVQLCLYCKENFDIK